MKLYNRQDNINWWGKGELTVEQMMEDPILAPMWDDEDDAVVLLDNGDGVVYYWRWLNKSLLSSYNIEPTDDHEQDFIALITMLSTPTVVIDPKDLPPMFLELGDVVSVLAESQLDTAAMIAALAESQMELASLVADLIDGNTSAEPEDPWIPIEPDETEEVEEDGETLRDDD